MAQEWHAQIDLANAELDKDHLTEALDLANGVIIKIQEGNTSSEIDQALFAKAQLVMVNVYLRQGRYEDALILIDKILHLAEEHKLLEAKAKSLHLSSKANFLLGAYERSLEYSTKALAAYEDIGDEPNQVNVIGNIGTIYLSLGSFDKALEFSAKALTIEEKNGNKSGVARLIANIGLIYIELESYEVALKYCKSALELHDELGEKSGVAAVTANIGLLYQAQGASQEAMEYMLKALAINEEIENKSEIALITMNIGCVCKELGNAEKSLEYFNRSLAIYEEIGAKSGIANVLGNMGIVFSNTNLDSYDDKKAEEYLLRAIEISKELGIQSFLIIFHKHLAELYKSENRWKEGYIQFEHYHEIEKEVQSEEANQKAIQLENRRKVDEAERDRQVKLARFQEQEKILLNILPAQIAERILEGEKQIADLHENVSVFFSDIVGFTQLSQLISPDELLSMLNEIFSEFDRIARKHGLEKIKTIGDAYMAVAGVPIDCEDHAERAAAFAQEVIEYMKVYRQKTNSELQIRVGLHCGRAIAGVIGENKFAYDLWGDSVNTASRMESHGVPGKIHVSEDFKNELSESAYRFVERGEMEVKGKGLMKTYFLEKEK